MESILEFLEVFLADLAIPIQHDGFSQLAPQAWCVLFMLNEPVVLIWVVLTLSRRLVRRDEVGGAHQNAVRVVRLCNCKIWTVLESECILLRANPAFVHDVLAQLSFVELSRVVLDTEKEWIRSILSTYTWPPVDLNEIGRERDPDVVKNPVEDYDEMVDEPFVSLESANPDCSSLYKHLQSDPLSVQSNLLHFALSAKLFNALDSDDLAID